MTDKRYTPSLAAQIADIIQARTVGLGAVAAREAAEAVLASGVIAQVRAETLREAAEDLAENWTTYSVGFQTHPAGIVTVSPNGYPTTGKALSVVLRARADRIEREGS